MKIQIFNTSLTLCSAFIMLSLFPACKKSGKDASVIGYLSCIVRYGQYIKDGDTTNSIYSQAGCSFTDAAGKTLDAGAPTINDRLMFGNDVVGEYYYGLNDTTDAFFSGGAYWNIPGSETLQGFTYDGGPIASFRMTLPDIVTKANGVSFTADIPASFPYQEVIVTIGDKDDKRVSKTFGSGDISFTAAELSALSTANGPASYITVQVQNKKSAQVYKNNLIVSYSVMEQKAVDIQ